MYIVFYYQLVPFEKCIQNYIQISTNRKVHELLRPIRFRERESGVLSVVRKITDMIGWVYET